MLISTSQSCKKASYWCVLWLQRFMAVLILAGLFLGNLSLSSAAEAIEFGYRGPSYPKGTGGNSEPTGEKPESKLWWNDGMWWGILWSNAGNAYHIYRLDLASQDWVDTGTAVDDREASRADALWDGQKLYVVSHIFAPNAGQAAPEGERGELYRFSYDAGTKIYSLDPGFPAEVTGGRSETLVVAKDGQGRLWVTYVENQTVMVNGSINGDDLSWGTPFALPIDEASDLSTDDISALVTFDSGNHIGVMWSNQAIKKMYFAVHPTGAPDNVWTRVIPYSVSADDHINLKSLEIDNAGNIYGVIKTSKNADLIVLLVCKRNINRCKTDSDWESHTVYSGSTFAPTRPILLIDTDNRDLYVFTRNKDSSGNSAVYYKRSSLDSIEFADGIGVPFIMSSTDTRINDPTSTKQNLNASTGLVVLASDGGTKYYFHNHMALDAHALPVGDFAASPATGTAPLTVDFNDASSGDPTSWSWEFGDGGTSTEPNPSHTYSNAGSYRVTLTVSNAAGNNTKTVTDYISVTPPSPVADFTASPATGTAPLTVDFNDASSGDPTSWSWEFGDGSTSTEPNPSHTYSNAGSYTVTLTVSNAAGNDTKTMTDYISVTLPPSPVAGFTAWPTTGSAPLTVSFSDLSSGSPTWWSWEFGDGRTSTERNPIHTYEDAGNYAVTLTAGNASGSVSETKANYITASQPSTQYKLFLSLVDSGGGG